MITIIYSTNKLGQYDFNFNKHINETVGIKGVQIIRFVNHGEYSLSELYNKGITDAKYNIIVALHNDVHLEKNWGKKLLKDFNNNPDYGIIGKAGSAYFPESGIYWENMMTTMVGQVYHHPPTTKRFLSKYSANLPLLIPVVTIDGLFIAFDKTKIKHKFDETIGKFHFYDHSFCIPNYIDGVKIGVTSSFDITHQSVGQPNQEFFDTKEKFLEKYNTLLPLDLKPSGIYIPEIKEKPLKNVGKVAVIIPTKGKVDLLKQAIDSFFEHCNPKLFDIFIADTGSSDEEKNEMKNYIKNTGIKLIEYDYYNFGKINNDVVKKHVTDEYEYLLFCNNDVKVLNNVIYNMLKTYNINKNTGTVGCRLHYGDNTIQHDGMVGVVDDKQKFHITHLGLNSYYKFSPYYKSVLGNTGAMLLIKKSIFIKCGMFNENYVNCFEDVELNLKCIVMGYQNYYDGESVAYHYESQTRNEDPDNIKKLNEDYNERLFPYFKEHYESFSNQLIHLEKQR